MASESYFNLQSARQKLIEKIALVNIDLDDMEAGIRQLPKSEQATHWDTLNRLDEMMAAIAAYDIAAQNYVRYHPAMSNTHSMERQLAKARRYVASLGGDWNTVLWGKLSDWP